MEVGDSVSSTLKKVFNNKMFTALKPAVTEERENLDDRISAIVQNATEVCFNKAFGYRAIFN